MKRKIVLTALVLIVAVAGFFIYKISRRITQKKEIAEHLKTMPTLLLFDMDSVPSILIHTQKPIILIHFNSQCDHCQYEAQEIQKNSASFKSTELIMISSEPISRIKSFSRQYKLEGYPYIHFAKIRSVDLYNELGNVSVPHIFIYGKDRKLVKEFKGETKIEALLQYASR